MPVCKTGSREAFSQKWQAEELSHRSDFRGRPRHPSGLTSSESWFSKLPTLGGRLLPCTELPSPPKCLILSLRYSRALRKSMVQGFMSEALTLLWRHCPSLFHLEGWDHIQQEERLPLAAAVGMSYMVAASSLVQPWPLPCCFCSRCCGFLTVMH